MNLPLLLFKYAASALADPVPISKTQQVSSLYQNFLVNDFCLEREEKLINTMAGFPAMLEWVPPKQLKQRGVGSIKGRCILIHALAHIEFNAINLALDAICRFQNMPWDYYTDWLRVAAEEAYHFQLLAQYLSQYDYQYGNFPVHNGLWHMAEETQYDVLARMACVPRLMEARGLDVAPMIAEKLLSAGDKQAADILEIIFIDEKTHVEIGNRWYHYLCRQRKIDPLSVFQNLVQKHAPGFLRGPYNIDARKQAGFDELELDWIQNFN